MVQYGSDIELSYIGNLTTVRCPLPSDRPPKSNQQSILSQPVNFAAGA